MTVGADFSKLEDSEGPPKREEGRRPLPRLIGGVLEDSFSFGRGFGDGALEMGLLGAGGSDG